MPTTTFNTNVSDVVVPEVFSPYVQQRTEEKSRLIQSGMISRNALLDNFLAGGGATINVPSWKDLDNTDENISGDQAADIFSLVKGTGQNIELAAALAALGDSRPEAIGTATEVAVRLNRNKSWASATLAAQLAGANPMTAIADLVAGYWARRLQKMTIATIGGVARDNGTNDSGDYAYEHGDVTVASSAANQFSAEAVLAAALTMGDSMDALTGILMHSVVYNRAQNNNLIDFIPDARGEVSIPTFLGKAVIVDDGMPTGTDVVRKTGAAGASGMYETWLVGPGFLQFGNVAPPNATETQRIPQAGNGGGQDVLYSRQQWCLHPVGHAFIGTGYSDGGPSNANSSGNLGAGGSWNRVYSERKQIGFARLITKES